MGGKNGGEDKVSVITPMLCLHVLSGLSTDNLEI